MKQNPDLPWDWKSASLNPNITVDDVLNNREIPWDWDYVSMMSSLREDQICDNPDIPWDSKLLSSNKNISAAFLIHNIYIDDDLPTEPIADDGANEANEDHEANEDQEANDHQEANEDQEANDDQEANEDHEDYEDYEDMDPHLDQMYDIQYDHTHRPIKVYDWLSLSTKSSLRIEHVMNNLNLPWKWEHVILNKSISLDDILNNLYDENNEPTPFTYLWYTITERVEDIEYPLTHLTDANGNAYEWKWDALSYKSSKLPSITVDVLVQHKDLEWGWDSLSENPNITMDDIIRTLPHNLPWDWKSLSLHKQFTIEQLVEFQDQIDWTSMSLNKHITPEMILTTPQLNWTENGIMRTLTTTQLLEELMEMRTFSTNQLQDDLIHNRRQPSETIDTLRRRHAYDNELHMRKDITAELLNAYPNYQWRWYSLSVTIPVEEIFSYPHLGWVWGYLSMRKDIGIDFILNNPQYPWTLHHISGNPKLTSNYINDHPEIKWECGNLDNPLLNMEELSSNELVASKTAFIKTQIQKRHELLTLNSIQRQTRINADLANLIAEYL
jgi:YD repeat-containing protein